MGAVLSTDGMYRYMLSRKVNDTDGCIGFFGINPSTADATIDDATVRKWKGFTARKGYGSFLVGNVFAYRATNVAELGNVEDPYGPENIKYLKTIIEASTILVPCWGNTHKVKPTLRKEFVNVLQLLHTANKPIKIFGLTNSGDPKHPLMLGYDTELKDFP